MPADLYLITPAAPGPTFLDDLAAVLAAGPVGALLVRRADMAPERYAGLVRDIAAQAQPQGCAVLIEGEPDDVARLDADGLHLSDPKGLKRALAALKPDRIVGIAAQTRHAAMTAGEDGVDYVLFGSLSDSIGEAERDLARWWAETMETPAVLSDPRQLEDIRSEGCEFVAIGDRLWQSPLGPGTAAATLLRQLETA